jgi:chromosomal replication initiation ATPase DnaA
VSDEQFHRHRLVPPATVGEVLGAVISIRNVDIGDLVGRSRHISLVEAREMATGLCRELTYASYPELAGHLGRRHHSTFVDQAKRWRGRWSEASRDAAREEVISWINNCRAGWPRP